MNKRKGFTLVEVLVSLTIIIIIGGMMVYAYLGTLNASRNLYLKEQTKLTLLEYMNYYSKIPLFPITVKNDRVIGEKHIDGVNLFNDGTNTRLKTFFGPIDTTSIVASSFNGALWVPVPIVATDSGAVSIVGLHKRIILAYQVIGWDYIKDRRYNYGSTMILSYTKPILDSAVTDDGIDIPLSEINMFNSTEGRIVVTTNQNKWINFYYKTPLPMSFRIERPDVMDCSFTGKIISFHQDVKDHYVLTNYRDISGIYQKETVKVTALNQAIMSNDILDLVDIQCLTIEGLAEWDNKHIGYITVVNSND